MYSFQDYLSRDGFISVRKSTSLLIVLSFIDGSMIWLKEKQGFWGHIGANVEINSKSEWIRLFTVSTIPAVFLLNFKYEYGISDTNDYKRGKQNSV